MNASSPTRPSDCPISRGDGLGQRPSPIPREDLVGQTVEQSGREAETEDQKFQGLAPQQGQRLIEVGDLAAEAEERAVDDPEDLARQRGVFLDAGLDRAGIGPWVAGEFQHFHGDCRQREKLYGIGHKMIQYCQGVRHHHRFLTAQQRACEVTGTEVIFRPVPIQVLHTAPIGSLKSTQVRTFSRVAQRRQSFRKGRECRIIRVCGRSPPVLREGNRHCIRFPVVS